jgi:hypothetical protein
VALNRIEAAARDAGYPVDRDETTVTIGGTPALTDFLVAEAKPMDVGTRVELRGRIDPQLAHRILDELAKSRPWTWAPDWDEGRS